MTNDSRLSFTGASIPLSKEGLRAAGDMLGVGAAEVWAVLAVETHGCGFLPDRRPLILFERHIFKRLTGGKYDESNPRISGSQGGYAGGAREYDRLAEALLLDRKAALESTSWGIGQVMGFNCRAAGYPSVDSMVAAATNSEDDQLAAVAMFLQAQKLAESLKQHDWDRFARGYNGPGFRRNNYGIRLTAAFAAYSNGGMPDIRVRQAQVLLMFLGFDVGSIDGIVGKRTLSAVAQFRSQQGVATGSWEALVTSLVQCFSVQSLPGK